MKFSHLHAVSAMVICGSMLMSCHSDVDLKNIDTTSELDLGLVLPIGSIKAKIGDFIGNAKNIYVDSLNNKGVITWKDTFKIERNYHQVDLSQYISSKEFSLKVYEQLEAAHMIGTDGKVTGTGNPVTLSFDLPLKLNGINDAIDNERLDSARIENASFASIINPDNLPLEWEWIDTVSLDLGTQINRPAGNTMVVYKKGDTGGYNQSITTDVDNFSLSMMKNRSLNPKTDWAKYDNNVIDSCAFKVNFTFTIPDGQKVEIPSNAKFRYDLRVRFIDYTAIWGRFVRSKDMYDEDTINLADSWGDLDFLRRAQLPFADPQIRANIVTKVAGAMVLQGDYLFVEDADGNPTYAEWDGQRTLRVDFKPYQYLDPFTSNIGDSTTNMYVDFNKDSDKGSIDRLFNNMPSRLGYNFNVNFNFQETPQIRIVPNTAVRVEAICKLPLIFNKGLYVDYSDTIKDIDLSKYTIDSLLNVKKNDWIDTVKTSDVNLILTAQNTIPLTIKATMLCIDEAGKVIPSPEDPTKPLNLFESDTIKIDPPTYAFSNANWNIVKEGENIITAKLTKEKLDLLPSIKQIIYTAIIDDESLEEAFRQGQFNIRITDDAGLKVKIGLTAQLGAVLNFNKNKDK
ncbi:MAG: hypothetical protein J5902_00250 [Paludibacteraceae bacterium]|nr:hypothetical protein [Paludibacteraceae bacterium]